MRLFFYAILMIAFTSLPAFTNAQQSSGKLITASFNHSNFYEVVKVVEAQSDYHFYFDKDDVDSLDITLDVKNAFIQSLLNNIFKNTDLNYVIDGSGNIFITRQIMLSVEMGNGKGEIASSDKKYKSKSSELADTTPVKSESPVFLDNKLYEVGLKTNAAPTGTVNIAGYITQIETGEAISGAMVYIDKPHIQVVSDQFGYYSVNLPAGRHTLNILAPGNFDGKRQVMLYSNGNLNIVLQQKVVQLKEVTIEATKVKNLKSLTMGVNKLDMAAMKQVTSAMGEVDVLRSVLSLPGVKSVGEASTGLNVRGGATDQNLILFNGMNVFNPSHLFGFFSAFDPDVVKDVTLYKSSITANYGGRISSVLDIVSLDGNNNKFSGSAGIGPLTSKLTLEGPVFNEKTTFIFGGRTTYSNWILKTLPQEYEKSNADFHDATIHLSSKFNKKNSLFVNGYYSGDKFSLNSDTSYQYHNINGNIQWKHVFNNRLYSVLSLGMDHYDYANIDNVNEKRAYKLSYTLDQYKLNLDFSHFITNKHKLLYGINNTFYNIKPGKFLPHNAESLIVSDILETEKGLESALFLSDQFTITPDFSIEAGVRLSAFNYLGGRTLAQYPVGVPRVKANITGYQTYSNNQVIQTYAAPEIRASARYSIDEKSSVKISYNTLEQYIHMLSNTTAISPTDIWKLSDPYIAPQRGKQVSIGFYRNFKANTIEASLELYYKWIDNYLDYKSGAVLVMNHNIETDVFKTKGKSYGAEFLLKKATGKINGWVSYTYSRSLIKQNDPLAGESINKGEFYPSNFDQPHNVTFIGNFRISHRYSISFNTTYNTGRPITLPIAVYDYMGTARLLYSDRNAYRIPDYFRTDFSMIIEGNHKIHQRTHNSWTFGIYNITARKNAYSVYYSSENGRIKGYKLSIFGTAIPFITYNIRF